jgi:hypothetical protein
MPVGQAFGLDMEGEGKKGLVFWQKNENHHATYQMWKLWEEEIEGSKLVQF